MTRKRILIFLGILPLAILLSITGCKKPEPAWLLVNVAGESFSDALLLLNGKQVGKLTKTLIKTDGRLFIDDVYSVTLPPGHRDIPEQDRCFGALDSLEIKPGAHTVLLQTEDGRSLQMNATLKPGLNIIDYDSDEQIIKWNDNRIKAAPDSTVVLP